MDKPASIQKVIFITGWGHSGSTILDLIVGSSPNVTTLGEMIFFNFYRDKQRNWKILRPFTCTCGKEFEDCEFWSAPGLVNRLQHTNIVYDRSNRDRFMWFCKCLLFKLSIYHPKSAAIGNDEQLFHRLKTVHKDRFDYICDSSKDFSRLARLIMNPNIEVYPILLIRDMKGVAYSYSKQKRVELGLAKSYFFSSAALWLFVNLFSWLTALMSGNVKSICYEDLCSNPNKIIEELNKYYNLSISPQHFLDNINDHEYHNIGGNLLRFKRLERLKINTEWRRKVSRIEAFAALLCFGLPARMLRLAVSRWNILRG